MPAYLEFNGFPCLNSAIVAAEMERLAEAGQHVSTQDWEGLANSFCIVRGADPSFAYLLVPAAAVNSVPSSGGPGLKIVCRDGSEQIWFKLNIETARKISPASKAEQGYYFIRAVDERHSLKRELVGKRFNRVISYTPPPPGSPPGIKGTFQYDRDTIKVAVLPGSGETLTPYTWKELFGLVWNITPAINFTRIDSTNYPAYVPQDLDWRYVTRRDALDQLLTWCNFSIQPKVAGGFDLVLVRSLTIPGRGTSLDAVLSSITQYLVSDRWPRNKQPGQPIAELELYFQILDPPNSSVQEYQVLERTPILVPDVGLAKAKLQIRIPSTYVIGDETVPLVQVPVTIADNFKTKQDDYFKQFPPTERTYAGYIPPAVDPFALSNLLLPGEFIERLTYFDVGDGPRTHVISIVPREWPPPYALESEAAGDSSFAWGDVYGEIPAGATVFRADNLKLIWGSLGNGIIPGQSIPAIPGPTDFVTKSVQVNNEAGEPFSNDSRIPLWSRRGSGVWYPDRSGGAGSAVLRFELTEDKSVSDFAVLAVVLDAAGNAIDPLFGTIYVLDYFQKFQGYEAYFDPLYAEQRGFLGTAVKVTDNFFLGIPGYAIIEMEHVARYIEATIHPDFPYLKTTGAGVAEPAFNFWDGRSPKTTFEPGSPGQSGYPAYFVSFADRSKIFSDQASPPLNLGLPSKQIKLIWDEQVEQFQLFAAEVSGGGGGNVLAGKLLTDLTIEMSAGSVVVVVGDATTPFGSVIVAENPVDELRTTPTTTFYEHVGNVDGNCLVIRTDAGFRLETVQPPRNAPVAP